MELKQDPNQITLLDLLLTIAVNIKLLFFGPLVVGLLALGLCYLLPQSFVSQAILALPVPTAMTALAVTPTQAATMMVSPLVMDPVIVSMNLADGLSIAGARLKLVSQIKAVVGKDGLLRFDVSAHTSLEAQAIANAVIDTWLKSTAPGAQDRADLEKRLALAKTSLASVSRVLESVAANGSSVLNKPITLGDAGTSVVALGELQSRYLTEVLSIPRTLQGLSRDVVVQPPTLSTEPVAPKKGLIVILAVLGSGVALMLWVFLRQTWKNAALDPVASEKQAKLYAAMGLKGWA